MKTLKTLILSTLLTSLIFACKTREDVKKYGAIENFPEDTLLQTINNKRAMIVLAHDDDMCAMAGTASLLTKSGWEVGVVSLTKSPQRDAAHVKACRNILDTVMFVHLTEKQIRKDSEKQRISHYAIPKDSFTLIFNKEIIEKAYEKLIKAFKPTVVFTLDNEIGG